MSLKKIISLPLNWLKKFGHTLGKIQTTLISSILYYIILTPLGLFFQLFSFIKRIFSIKPKKTYWLPRDYKNDLENIYNQF